MIRTITYDDTLYQLVPKEPLSLDAFSEVCHDAHIAFCLDKFPSYERAIEHYYLKHQEMLSAAPTPQAQLAERVPLTEERIHELLGIGNPSEEVCRLIRLGWDAAHGITSPKEPS